MMAATSTTTVTGRLPSKKKSKSLDKSAEDALIDMQVELLESIGDNKKKIKSKKAEAAERRAAAAAAARAEIESQSSSSSSSSSSGSDSEDDLDMLSKLVVGGSNKVVLIRNKEKRGGGDGEGAVRP